MIDFKTVLTAKHQGHQTSSSSSPLPLTSPIFIARAPIMITALLILLPIAYYTYRTASRFWRNWQDAKKSGIPYILAPVYGFDRLWLLTQALWFPVINRLPNALTSPWKDVVGGDWSWHGRYAPFAAINSDTFIVVSPKKNILYTADAEVINQITTRRNDFPKPVTLYKALDIYGKNVVTTEGSDWRRQRKITAPPFGEQNNRVVWKESIFQANEMVRSWLTLGEKLEKPQKADQSNGRTEESAATAVADNVSKDTMRLSLHVISRAGFDVRCLWPGMESSSGVEEGAMKSGEVPPGHLMSYTDSIQTLLHRIVFVLIFPPWLLSIFPAKIVREAGTAYEEWGKYMQHIYDRNVRVIEQNVAEKKTQKDGSVEGLDLMGSMIEQSGLIEGTRNHGSANAGLTQSEVIGNSFVLLVAGHETAANSIHFCMLYLALRPGLQRRLQAELDTIFGTRDPAKDEWDYDTDLPKLFAGLTGAIMNEELRLIPPVINIPKSTEPGRPMALTIAGKPCTVPGGTYIGLNTCGVHRNPKHWPHGPVRTTTLADGTSAPDPIHPRSNLTNDLEEFKPERWLLDEQAQATQQQQQQPSERGAGGSGAAKPAADDLAINAAPDTAPSLYRPPRGAYIPFSEGFRSCVGRRFAQVEILASLAVVFRAHSVELSVAPSEDELAAMGGDEKKAVWLRARKEAELKLRDDMGTVITLQLRGEGVKVRVCPRGAEVFDYREF